MEPAKTYYRSYADWMSSYPWEAVATLTFRYPKPSDYTAGPEVGEETEDRKVSEETAQRMFKEWCRENAKLEGVRIACQGVLNFKAGNPHIHILMLARSRKNGKTLLDLNLKRLENRWPAIAEVSVIRDMEATASYIFVRNTEGRHLFVDYGTNLLKEITRSKE